MSAQASTGFADLKERTGYAVPLFVLLIVGIHFGGLFFAIVASAVGVICYFELARIRAYDFMMWLAGGVAVAAMIVCAHYAGQPVLEWAWLVVGVGLMTVSYCGPLKPVADFTEPLLGVMWIGYGLMHAVLLRDLHHGAGLLTMVLAGVIANDIVALLVGRRFGRTPLPGRLAKISEKKTSEGAAAGCTAAWVATVYVGQLYGWLDFWQLALLGVVVAGTAFAGDLFESWVKRRSGAKDMSKLLGAHGGLLDRIDGMLFAVVAGYWVVVAYGQ